MKTIRSLIPILVYAAAITWAAASAPADSCLLFYGTSHSNSGDWPLRDNCIRYSISPNQWTVQKGDVLEYEIFIPPANPQKNGGIELLGENDAPTLAKGKAKDQTGLSADPATVLDPAVDKWYARQIPLDALVGQKIRHTALVLAGKLPTDYVLFVDNIRIRHADKTATVVYENGPAPRVGMRRLAVKSPLGLGASTIDYDAENGLGPFGPVLLRTGYASYPALLSIARDRVKPGQSVVEFVQRGREQGARQRQAQKLALELHFLKTWAESATDRTEGEQFARIPYIKAWSELDRNLGLEKELADMSGRIDQLFDPGLSEKAFEAGWKDAAAALAGLSKTAAARAREKLASLEKQGPQITVDFAKEMGPVTYRASGFLHMCSSNEPPDEVILPLKPQANRSRNYTDYGVFATYERARRLGVKHQSVVVSSLVHDSGLIPLPGVDNDWSKWEAAVDQMVKEALSRHWQIEWDVWNEPSGTYEGRWQIIGQQTGQKKSEAEIKALWFETWRRAVVKIRALDPKAIIVGPSDSGFSAARLQGFLLYCRDNNVLPDVLSWHEYSNGGTIVRNVQAMRDFMKTNNIPELAISMNEYQGPEDQFHPGAAVSYISGLERARVDSANRACWGDESCGNCEIRMLNGLVTQPEKEPRSTWWAYKGYADITGTLVDWQAETWWWAAIAGRDAARQQARVLLSRHHGDVPLPFSPCVVRFVNLDKATGVVKNNKVRVTGAWIPDSNARPLLRPLATLDGEYEVKDNTLTVVIPHLGPHDAYELTVGVPDKRE